MVSAARRPCRRSCTLALVLPFAVLAALTVANGQKRPAPVEVRALWVARTSLTSPSAVNRMVSQARAGGFNTLLVQVRGRGDAYFNDGLEPKAAALASQPDAFDPLAAVLKLAHERNLRVHAWVNVGLVSSAVHLPASRQHLVYRHPEWLMVPKALARELTLLSPTSQLYRDKLVRWTRSQTSDVEGLYVSPIPDAAADATVAVVADIVARYPVDGVHLDYLRYPTPEFDYGRESLVAFKSHVLTTFSEADRRRRERGFGSDLVAWTDAFPEEWREFRRERLTTLVGRIRESVKARRPGALVTAAVLPDAGQAATERLQDWDRWMRLQFLDAVCPMAYATDSPTFASQIAGARRTAGTQPLWAGIGAYRLSTSQTIENIETARRLGAAGIILFSYDSLVNAPRGGDYLSQVGRAAFAK